MRVHPTEFEKDDATNFHVQFVAAAANLRARNYRIPEADEQKVPLRNPAELGCPS